MFLKNIFLNIRFIIRFYKPEITMLVEMNSQNFVEI